MRQIGQSGKQKKGVKRVVRTLADGTVKVYEYSTRRSTKRRDTFGAILEEYKSSPEFTILAPATKLNHLRAFDKMKSFDGVLIGDIKRRQVLRLRDAYADKPGIANQIVDAVSRVMSFAVDREYREDNPIVRVKRFKSVEYAAWPPEAVDYAVAKFPERLRRAVLLALYTGQREGDVVAMTWADYDGSGVAVVQQKTGEKLWIPAHRDLRAEMDRWRLDTKADTILTDARGRPWRKDSFATVFYQERRQHAALDGLVFHGLRKTAAARLAEAGCSALEIGAITGHRTLGMLELYTRGADQRVRASAAILKLENVRKQAPQEPEE